MCLRLLAAVAAACTAAASWAASPPVSVVFDRTSLAPAEGAPAGRGARALLVAEQGPRWGLEVLALPVAWSASNGSVVLDPSATQQLRDALEGFDAPARVADRLVSRAAEASESLPLLPPSELSLLLIHESRGAADLAQEPSALVRLLTRGNVRDRWAVPAAITSTDPDAAPVEIPAPRLLQVELVSFGLHLGDDAGALPPRFAHVGLRARLWSLREGRRDWDRAFLLGAPLADDGDSGGAFRALAELLLDEAADRLAADLWPDLDLELGGAPATESPAPSLPSEEGLEAAPVAPPAAAAGDATTLLRRLAEARLTSAPPGDPWPLLARAVRPELTDALSIALSCAEDPLGAAVQTGSKRLGLGLADTYRRVEQSAAFRKALAEDLLDQVARQDGDDWPLERAVRYLVSDMLDLPAPEREAPAVAGPLLQRARLDGAKSPAGLASLLIGLKIWPEGGLAMLEDLVGR